MSTRRQKKKLLWCADQLNLNVLRHLNWWKKGCSHHRMCTWTKYARYNLSQTSFWRYLPKYYRRQDHHLWGIRNIVQQRKKQEKNISWQLRWMAGTRKIFRFLIGIGIVRVTVILLKWVNEIMLKIVHLEVPKDIEWGWRWYKMCGQSRSCAVHFEIDSTCSVQGFYCILNAV